jgi:hypothetical protein
MDTQLLTDQRLISELKERLRQQDDQELLKELFEEFLGKAEAQQSEAKIKSLEAIWK